MVVERGPSSGSAVWYYTVEAMAGYEPGYF